MRKITIYSRAKINLGLNITRKREDGFHDLETLFYPIQLCDFIVFEKSDSSEFQTDSPVLNTSPEDNLIIRAKRKIEQTAGKEIHVKIRLEKNIPMGAGLGGGSSNAAMTLLSLNELFELKIPDTVLHLLAAELGSDVPFFLNPRPAFGFGRGTELTRADVSIQRHLVLVYPHIHVSTAFAYKNVRPLLPRHPLMNFSSASEVRFDEMKAFLKNDFEGPIFSAFPEIASIKQNLLEGGAELALMSGSGSSVFGFFKNADTAQAAAQSFSKRYFVHTEECS